MGTIIHIRRDGMVPMVGAPTGLDRPPTRGAPAPVYPITVNAEQRALAPVPLVDRFPFVVGQALSATYLASVFRLATTGYRQQFVDLLDELLEQDAHLFSVIQKRILSVANGRMEIVPPKLPKGHKDTDKAKAIAEDTQARVDRIPDRSQAVASLLWAIYHGLTTAEIFWNRDHKGWSVDRLGFVHSRRLSYPDGQSWDLYIWDQGQVLGWNSPWGTSPTNSGIFGLRVADYPGKFIVHAPQLRGDYPTRDGVGRETAIWALFKRIGARGASSYLERFAKGFMDVSYTTSKDGKPREATTEDIALAERIAASLGPGSGSLASHADSIQINAKSFDGGSGSKLTWQEWIGLCDAQMSKAVLGGTLGTEVGKGGGNRALGEVQERGEVDLEQYDATTFGETFRRDVVSWLVRLNHPGFEHLTPRVLIHVDTDPDPKQLVEVATGIAKIGGPVDLDELSSQTGVPLVPNTELDEDGKPKPRRAYLPDVTPPASVDDGLLSEAQKQREADQVDHDDAVEMQKAKQPVVAPGAAPADPPAAPPARNDGGSKKAKKGAKGNGGKPEKKPTAKGPTAKKVRASDRGTLPDAAIAIVWNQRGQVLTVSRPEPPHEMSLPGGLVEDGEAPVQAAIRELAEECGVDLEELRHLAELRSPTDGRTVHVFQVDDWAGDAKALEAGTRIAWLTPEELFAQARLYRPTIRELMAEDLFVDPVPHQSDDVRATDEPSPENRALREALLLSDREDRDIAREVFEQLLEDYPRESLAWVLAAHWKGPTEIPLEEVDFANRKSWRASHEDITPYVERFEKGKRKPAIVVKTPGNPKFVIVDGHHRTLASEKLGWPLLAYEASVPTDNGPWMTLHDVQKNGSSKGSASWLKKRAAASWVETQS